MHPWDADDEAWVARVHELHDRIIEVMGAVSSFSDRCARSELLIGDRRPASGHNALTGRAQGRRAHHDIGSAECHLRRVDDRHLTDRRRTGHALRTLGSLRTLRSLVSFQRSLGRAQEQSICPKVFV
jgi:hypothetical protein